MKIIKLFLNYQQAIDDLISEWRKDAQGNRYKYTYHSFSDWSKFKEKIVQLKKFRTDYLALSQTEPILLDNSHLWYIQVKGIEQPSFTKHKIFLEVNPPVSLWLYQDAIYGITGSTGTYTEQELKLLILEYVDKERRKFEQLKNKFSDKNSKELTYDRLRIPEKVRIAVWRRDQGRCVRCGSRENLEYDHIVPISKGGSNTERNIELLCQNCNRTKSDQIK
jgi:hypothetical protein